VIVTAHPNRASSPTRMLMSPVIPAKSTDSMQPQYPTAAQTDQLTPEAPGRPARSPLLEPQTSIPRVPICTVEDTSDEDSLFGPLGLRGGAPRCVTSSAGHAGLALRQARWANTKLKESSAQVLISPEPRNLRTERHQPRHPLLERQGWRRVACAPSEA
jgi:hypothetical protein